MKIPSGIRFAPLALAAVSLLVPGRGLAQMPFAPFGARQVALGGASVGLGDDPASFVDNPALLTPADRSASISYGVYAISSNDFVPKLEGVTGHDPVALASPDSPDAAAVRANLFALSAPGTSVLGDGRSAIATAVGGFGVFVGTTQWTAAFARADLVHVAPGTDPATSFAYNDSAVAFRSLSLQDYAVARAFPFFEGAFVLGVTGHFLRGTTGIKEESAFTTDIGNLETFVRRGASGIERTRSRFSYDVGGVLALGIFRFGGVVKGVNRPQFPFDDETAPLADRGTSVVVGRQSRIGASLLIPGIRLRIAADLDLGKNETLAPGQLSRNIGGGLELPLGKFDLRGGLSENLEAPDRPLVYSFGLAFGTAAFKVDAAAVYRAHDGAYGGVLSVRAGL